MLKRFLLIVLFFSVLWFSATKMLRYVRSTTSDLKIESEQKWTFCSQKFQELPKDFEFLWNDTTNYDLKTNISEQLNQFYTIENQSLSEEFVLICFDFNEHYMALKNQLQDSLSQISFSAVDKKLDVINDLSKDYNESCKKHNTFMGSMPNFYLLKKDNRRRLPYFSITFNQKNLNPLLYKKRFDKYMETGQDRFLNEPHVFEVD